MRYLYLYIDSLEMGSLYLYPNNFERLYFVFHLDENKSSFLQHCSQQRDLHIYLFFGLRNVFVRVFGVPPVLMTNLLVSDFDNPIWRNKDGTKLPNFTYP